MSCQSTILKNLLLQEVNPKKTEVQFQINGWLQTNRKIRNLPKSKQSRYYQKQSSNILQLRLNSLANERTQNNPSNGQQNLISSNVLLDKISPHDEPKQIECRLTTSSSHQSRGKIKAELTINEIIAMKDDKDNIQGKIRVFNSGYIVNQMRRKLKQKQSLKKYVASKFSMSVENDRPILLKENNHQLISKGLKRASIPLKTPKSIEKMPFLSYRR